MPERIITPIPKQPIPNSTQQYHTRHDMTLTSSYPNLKQALVKDPSITQR